MNILFPIAGYGTKFNSKGFNEPKPFVKVKDKYIIEYALSSLKLKGKYYIITRLLEDKYINILNEIGKKYFIYDDYGAYPDIKKAITDLIEFNKIKIVCKIGHSQEEKFTRQLTHANWLSTIQPSWYQYSNNKEYDVSAMFSPSQKDTFEHGINHSIFYKKHRDDLFKNLNNKYKITKLVNNKKYEINEYYNRMYNSKIVLAPFRFGEISPRDLESAMFGSVLIKPDMSLIETLPNVYIPNETYIPCKHDFSDLDEKIDYVLSNYNHLQKKLVENFRKKYIEEYNPEKLVMYYYNIFKNIDGITTE
jgi:hypothetical protein